MTAKADAKLDRKAGIKEGSKRDERIDKKRGVVDADDRKKKRR